jgi:two-component system, response regulator
MVATNEVEILLVEDNPDDVQLTLRELRRHHLANKVQVARDGAEALEFVFSAGPYAGRDISHQPKMILLDLKLPKVDGLEVLHRLKSDQGTKSIPVVVLTSSKEEQDLVKSCRLGANNFIVKPVDFDKFASIVSGLGFYWILLNRSPQ